MKKQQVFYIHGGDAFSNHDDFLRYLETKGIWDLPTDVPVKKWTGTFRDDLGDEYEVFMPQMPNAQNARYAEWKIWFERHFEYLHNDIILVGWSLGGSFFVKYLLENTPPFRCKHLILVAAPWEIQHENGEDGGDFVFDTSRVGELAKKVPNITLFHSKDDFVVPYEHALRYKNALLSAELVAFEDKNHFLVPEFPELVEAVRGAASAG